MRVMCNTEFMASHFLIYPCPKASCENWDSDRNGGHCMCLNPPCLECNGKRKPKNNNDEN